MKLFLIISSSLFILFLVFQVYTAMATEKTDEQPYTVIKKETNFEIRFYPSVSIASITSRSKSFKELGSEGFRKLAGYIFGGNEENKSIAMTSPVSMSIQETSSTMSFVMPSGFNLDNLPTPNDTDVKLTMTDEEYVAVISWGGFASDQEIQSYSNSLQKMLTEKNIKIIGNIKFLGYNPPYQLINRRNEIAVRIEWNKG